MPSDEDIAAVLMELAHRRGRGASFCPSEVARALAQDWRPIMPEVRRVATGLAAAGQLQVTQKGQPVDPEAARGAIRLRLG
jgi:hypothetical protein